MKILLIFFTAIISVSSLGQTWLEIPVPTQAKLLAIDFPSTSTGYIVGTDTTLLKSTDGGQTWQQLPLTGIQFPSSIYSIYDVDFVDENIGCILTDYSGAYKTVDGGQNWALIGGQGANICSMNTMYVISEDEYFLGGSGCFTGAELIQFTNNAWVPASILNSTNGNNSLGRIQELSFANANVGLGATLSDQMIRTTDGGVTWDTVSTGLPSNGYLTSVIMVNDTLCFSGYAGVGTNGLGILTSTDGGVTWFQDINSATFSYPDYLCVTSAFNGDIYTGGVPSGGIGGLILEKGASNTFWNFFNVNQPINALDSYGDDVMFAVGDSGYVVVNKDLSTIGLKEPILLESILLYPNPAQDQLNISTELNVNELKIYDPSGSEQCIKEDTWKASGKLDISHLKHGMYMLVLETSEGRFTQKFCRK